jgi:hypothetical protein
MPDRESLPRTDATRARAGAAGRDLTGLAATEFILEIRAAALHRNCPQVRRTRSTSGSVVTRGHSLRRLKAQPLLRNYISAYAAVFVLRRREPALARPYRAFGYPLSTGVVLVGSILFLVAAVAEDRRSAIIVAGLFVASVPACALMVRRRNSVRAES